jgi:hypothetical protein
VTPSQLLEAAPVHSIGEAAVILALDGRKDGGRSIVRTLIREGKLALVDDTQPVHRWTVSTVELQRYIAHGPRRPATDDPFRLSPREAS